MKCILFPNNCSTNHGNCKSVSLFNFPKDKVVLEKYLKFCGLNSEESLSKSARLCSVSYHICVSVFKFIIIKKKKTVTF